MKGPETVIAFTLIVPVLLFETEIDSAGLELLTSSVPKVRLLGDIVRFPATEVETPVPARLTTEGEFLALLLIVKLPLAAPDALGLKITLNVTLSPGFNVVGKTLPADVKGPETVIALTVIVPVLLFETVALCATLELLTVTLPKLSEVVDRARARSTEGCVTFVLVYPAQDDSIAKKNNWIAKPAATPNLLPGSAFSLFRTLRRKKESSSLSEQGRV